MAKSSTKNVSTPRRKGNSLVRSSTIHNIQVASTRKIIATAKFKKVTILSTCFSGRYKMSGNGESSTCRAFSAYLEVYFFPRMHLERQSTGNPWKTGRTGGSALTPMQGILKGHFDLDTMRDNMSSCPARRREIKSEAKSLVPQNLSRNKSNMPDSEENCGMFSFESDISPRNILLTMSTVRLAGASKLRTF